MRKLPVVPIEEISQMVEEMKQDINIPVNTLDRIKVEKLLAVRLPILKALVWVIDGTEKASNDTHEFLIEWMRGMMRMDIDSLNILAPWMENDIVIQEKAEKTCCLISWKIKLTSFSEPAFFWSKRSNNSRVNGSIEKHIILSEIKNFPKFGKFFLYILERDILDRDGLFSFCSSLLRLLIFERSSVLGSSRSIASSSTWRREENHIVRDYLCLVALHPTCIIPTTSLEVSFDVDFFSLVHVLLCDISQSAPSHTVVEFCVFLEHSTGILPSAIGRDGKGSYLLSVGSFADLWLSRKIADKLYLVERIAHKKKC
jgi:hypothetical protein